MKKLIQSLKDDPGFRGAVLFLFLMPLTFDLIIMFIDQRKHGGNYDFVPAALYGWGLLPVLLIGQYVTLVTTPEQRNKFYFMFKVVLLCLACLSVLCALIYLLSEYIT